MQKESWTEHIRRKNLHVRNAQTLILSNEQWKHQPINAISIAIIMCAMQCQTHMCGDGEK